MRSPVIILTYLQLFIRVLANLHILAIFHITVRTTMNVSTRVFTLLCFVFFLVTIGHTPGVCTEDEISGQSDSPYFEEAPGFSPAQWLISIYKDHISPVNADRCPSFPSCSSYAEQAIKKHGFFIGWMMTVDRLIHEGKEETSVSPYIYSNGELLILDPVENNDFWWYPRDGKHHE